MAVFIFLYIQVLSSKYSHYIDGLVQDCGNSSGVTTVLYYAIDYCPEHFHVQHTAAKSRHINFLGKTSMSNTTVNLKLCSSRFDATGCCEIQCHLLLWDPRQMFCLAEWQCSIGFMTAIPAPMTRNHGQAWLMWWWVSAKQTSTHCFKCWSYISDINHAYIRLAW